MIPLLPFRGGSLWWFLFVGRHQAGTSVLIFQLLLVCFSSFLDLRSCVEPLHASLCAVFQCALRPCLLVCLYLSVVLTWTRFLHVHFKAVAVTRLPWIRFLHALCSVSAAADPPTICPCYCCCWCCYCYCCCIYTSLDVWRFKVVVCLRYCRSSEPVGISICLMQLGLDEFYF